MHLRYRIGIINDFRNEFSFIDYQRFGDLQIWDACKASSERRHQLADDSISVFLNFKKLAEFKENDSASHLILKLLKEAPVDLSEFENYLILNAKS